MRACQEMGIATVAVHSTADAQAMHVRLADESVCIGPPPAAESYLKSRSILLAAAEITGADAIHPGYGFLSENADFAADGRGARLHLHRPVARAYPADGRQDRRQGRRRKELGIPTVPGSDGADRHRGRGGRAAPSEIGFPVLIKAVAGGGGRGMTVVARPRRAGRSACAWPATRPAPRSATTAVYVEQFLDRPRHIEVQVIGDGQRPRRPSRRARLLAAAPPPEGGRGGALAGHRRRDSASGSARSVVEALRKLGYRSLGTVEFLYEDGEFFFIEMNTRLQVEHPVTELVTGIDLVREQIRIAAGEPLGFTQEDVAFTGHAIEVPDQRRGPAHPHCPRPAG